MSNPRVSVIVTTHSWRRFGAFSDVLNALENQTYDNYEIVCPIDTDEQLAVAADAITDGGTHVQYHSQGAGLAEARNRGARQAHGDIYAFIDDDAVPTTEWLSELVIAYENGAIAAGGPAIPDWPTTRPWWIPESWDWLIGGGPYHDQPTEVRNTYGCNISFQAEVFDDLGGFDESLGKNDSLQQGEETDLARRMHEAYGKRVCYRPGAVVHHQVFPEQLHVPYLIMRAYAQGQTKRRIGVDEEETGFLTEVVREFVSQPPHQSVATLAYTAATGLGFVRGPPRGDE